MSEDSSPIPFENLEQAPSQAVVEKLPQVKGSLAIETAVAGGAQQRATKITEARRDILTPNFRPDAQQQPLQDIPLRPDADNQPQAGQTPTESAPAQATATTTPEAAATPEQPEKTEAQQKLEKAQQKLADIIALNQQKLIEQQFDQLDPMVMQNYGADRDEQRRNFVRQQAEQWAKLITEGKRNIDEIVPGVMKRTEGVKLRLNDKGEPLLDENGLPQVEMAAEKRDKVWEEFARENKLSPELRPENLENDPRLKAQFEEFIEKTIDSENDKETFKYKLYKMGVIPLTRYVSDSLEESDMGSFIDFVISGHGGYGSHGRRGFEKGETPGSEIGVDTFYDLLGAEGRSSGTVKMEKLGQFAERMWEFLQHEHRELGLSDLEELPEPPTVEALQAHLEKLMEAIRKVISVGEEMSLTKLNALLLHADGESDSVREKVLGGHLKEEKGKKFLGEDVLRHLNRLASSSSFAERFFELDSQESKGTQPAVTPAQPRAA